MAYQSPYRGEEDLIPPRTREWISRGSMLLIGVALAYFSIRGMVLLSELRYATATQPALSAAGQYVRRTRVVPVFPLLVVIFGGLLGVSILIAAVMPVQRMQSLFERFYRPPVTGDRSALMPHRSRTPWWLGGRGGWW